MEMRGRLGGGGARRRAESRAQATRAESVAQNLVVGARDNMEQIGNRISVEQSSDAKRLDTLSSEIARLTREVADARGDDLSKRQLMEADIARIAGQKSSETRWQIGDVRANSTPPRSSHGRSRSSSRSRKPAEPSPRRGSRASWRVWKKPRARANKR